MFCTPRSSCPPVLLSLSGDSTLHVIHFPAFTISVHLFGWLEHPLPSVHSSAPTCAEKIEYSTGPRPKLHLCPCLHWLPYSRLDTPTVFFVRARPLTQKTSNIGRALARNYIYAPACIGYLTEGWIHPLYFFLVCCHGLQSGRRWLCRRVCGYVYGD